MNKIIFSIFIFISNINFSQNFKFEIKWNEGDTKLIAVTQTVKHIENDSIIYEDKTTYEYHLKVLKHNKDSCIVELIFPNPVLEIGKEIYEKIEEELPNFKELKLKYNVNIKTNIANLINSDEIRNFTKESINKVSNLVKEKKPETYPNIGFSFIMIKMINHNNDNIKLTYENFMNTLLIPYSKDFKVDSTIIKTEIKRHSILREEKFPITTLTTLNKVDETSGQCLIKEKKAINFSKKIEKIEENIYFGKNNYASNRLITFNYRTSWISKYEEVSITIDEYTIDSTKYKTKTESIIKVKLK
jgi:hypothetical protein